MSEQQLTACKALGKLWNTLVLPNGGSMSQGFSRERTGKMAVSQSFLKGFDIVTDLTEIGSA